MPRGHLIFAYLVGAFIFILLPVPADLVSFTVGRVVGTLCSLSPSLALLMDVQDSNRVFRPVDQAIGLGSLGIAIAMIFGWATLNHPNTPLVMGAILLYAAVRLWFVPLTPKQFQEKIDRGR